MATDNRAHLLVVGGGPAGIEATLEAARLGADVILVEAESLGGRANTDSLLPSKVWLNAADRIGAHQGDAELGMPEYSKELEAGVITRRVRELSSTMGAHYAKQLEVSGVKVASGQASFIDERRLRVGDREYSADNMLIATGSGPIFPPAIKPDMKRIIAPRFMSKLPRIPGSILVVGGGVTGTEFAYLFDRLGSEVTWLVDEFGVLPPCDRDAVAELTDLLVGRGVKLVEGSAVQQLTNEGERVVATLADDRNFTADYAFIAIGRRPFTQGINLEAAGVKLNNAGAIEVNEFQQSNVRHIYAAGDVAGGPMTANKATAQGRIAARHALGKPIVAFHWESSVEAVYTDPEFAQVGLTEHRARAQGLTYETLKLPFSESLKARLLGDIEGFLKLLYEPETGRLLGAAAVGVHAADIMTVLAVGVQQALTVADLASLSPGYPTLSDLVTIAARRA